MLSFDRSTCELSWKKVGQAELRLTEFADPKASQPGVLKALRQETLPGAFFEKTSRDQRKRALLICRAASCHVCQAEF